VLLKIDEWIKKLSVIGIVFWEYHELGEGHDVMITAPKGLVQLLET
jgi:hypothetical protein